MKLSFNHNENQQISLKKSKKEGAIVAVIGLFDKGKTFILN